LQKKPADYKKKKQNLNSGKKRVKKKKKVRKGLGSKPQKHCFYWIIRGKTGKKKKKRINYNFHDPHP